jgi:SAM-dependent MidA family methyltransferase
MIEAENKELIRIIQDRMREKGRLTFAEFLDWVLYHPVHGYYNREAERFGPRGDYYTSANMHPIFGRLIARQMHGLWEALGHPHSFSIVEFGPGTGAVARDILEECRTRFSPLYEILSYILVERSRSLPAKQERTLAEWVKDGKVRWEEPENFLGGGKKLVGCIFSNELIDAFPVHRVQRERGKLQEIYVIQGPQGFGEALGPLSHPFLEEYFLRYGKPLEDGQRGEVNWKALEWMDQVSEILEEGYILTIDYGFEAGELYHPWRKAGTLLGYFRHKVSDDPFAHIGHQDLTSHVNFTALVRRGEERGLEKIGLIEQYRFLVGLGLLEELEEWEKKAGELSGVEFIQGKLGMRNFLIPGGMGSLFKVLLQQKRGKGSPASETAQGIPFPWNRFENGHHFSRVKVTLPSRIRDK